MSSLDSAARAYVRFVLSQLGIAPSALAKLAGISSSTLTRPLNNPDFKFAISTSTLNKLYEATGINPAPFFEAKDSAEVGMIPFESKDVFTNADERDKYYDENNIDFTKVIMIAQAGVWREPYALKIGLTVPVFLRPCGPYKRTDYFGIIIGDESCNRFARPRDIGICVRRRALEYSLTAGHTVAVERHRLDEDAVEITIRRIVALPSGGWHLELRSKDPQFQHNIHVENLEDSDSIKLLGRVMYAVRDTERPDD